MSDRIVEFRKGMLGLCVWLGSKNGARKVSQKNITTKKRKTDVGL